MNKELFYLIFAVTFLASCSSKKPVMEEVTPPVQEVKVAETAAQMDGKKLFQQSCVNCHKLYEPTDYTAQQWQPIMARMQKKARLNDAEALAIYTYLTTTPQ